MPLNLWGGDKVSLVRFHVGDIDPAPELQRFTDDDITALLEMNEGDVGTTVILCLEHLIAVLSQPNFTADWLTVDNATARRGYETILHEKRARFGLYNEGMIVPAKRRGMT